MAVCSRLGLGGLPVGWISSQAGLAARLSAHTSLKNGPPSPPNISTRSRTGIVNRRRLVPGRHGSPAGVSCATCLIPAGSTPHVVHHRVAEAAGSRSCDYAPDRRPPHAHRAGRAVCRHGIREPPWDRAERHHRDVVEERHRSNRQRSRPDYRRGAQDHALEDAPDRLRPAEAIALHPLPPRARATRRRRSNRSSPRLHR